MGQCSTLPAEGRASTSVNPTRHEKQMEQMHDEQRHRLKDDNRRESLDFNKLETPERHSSQEPPKKQAMKRANTPPYNKNTANTPNSQMEHAQPQSRDAEEAHNGTQEPESMDIDSREEPPAAIPPPPEAAVRTRCYKLNLDSEILGLKSSQRLHMCLGPFTEPPPFLTYTTSEDSTSSGSVDPTQVAIRTAQIFRGITIGRDGTILSQNARATRSNRGNNKTKRGEKSRQAAKIDKAKDLVEESIVSGKVPGTDDPAKMVSLVIVGEYDDMKYLVRDGSKKLKDADGHPDELLLSLNRSRGGSKSRSSTTGSSIGTPRKRVSPNFVASPRSTTQQQLQNVGATGMPNSAPPKLKSHPRDTRPVRREERGSRVRLESCHDFDDPPRANGGVSVDGDWSHAWNLWNCGGTGTVSPLQPSSPKDGAKVNTRAFEGRESNFTSVREGGVTSRAN